jgi:predicted nucleotidyltransferase
MAANQQLQLREMLEPVAKALGPELLPYVAFVGGATTSLLISDPFTREAVRFTEDIDLIAKVESHAQWQRFRQQLHQRGFKESMEDEVICRMRLGHLKVDFMPTDESILGFSNRWYHKALATAQPYPLTAELTINLLAPEYFVATKLEAWRGRGGNDPMQSHDLEDIINLLDGREELALEIAQAEGEVRDYIARQFSELLKHPDFEYAVQGNVRDTERSELVFKHMEHIIQGLT